MGEDTTLSRSKLSAVQSGIAGEYVVAGELSRRGYIASLTLRNTRGVDLLVSNADATRCVGVQVKTAKGQNNWWLVKPFEEEEDASNLFFVFVSLQGLDSPRYHIVPKREVAVFAEANHKRWLAGRTKVGGIRKDTNMRKFIDKEGKYVDRWDLLGLDQT